MTIPVALFSFGRFFRSKGQRPLVPKAVCCRKHLYLFFLRFLRLTIAMRFITFTHDIFLVLRSVRQRRIGSTQDDQGCLQVRGDEKAG